MLFCLNKSEYKGRIASYVPFFFLHFIMVCGASMRYRGRGSAVYATQESQKEENSQNTEEALIASKEDTK
jgi:hypothetical protein